MAPTKREIKIAFDSAIREYMNRFESTWGNIHKSMERVKFKAAKRYIREMMGVAYADDLSDKAIMKAGDEGVRQMVANNVCREEVARQAADEIIEEMRELLERKNDKD